MPNFRKARVAEVLLTRPGLQRLRLKGGDRAYALTELTGPVERGDRVIVNTTAVDLELGTGGWHVVHWNLSRKPWRKPGRGHVMKLRYTSLQADTGSAMEDREITVDDLGGIPVVVCGLHSQVGVVTAVARHLRPDAQITYVMTDGAALPIVLSDLVVALSEARVIDQTITAGNAFGGQLEVVSVASGLLVAADDGADLVVVGMGPGVVGTGSRLGTTAVEVATICDTVDALAGRAVMCLRASSGDERPRHLGLSHHSRTALDLVRTTPAVFVPEGATLGGLDGVDHAAVEIPDVGSILERFGLTITSMGRSIDDDPLFFSVAAAAAVGACDPGQ